MKPAPSRELLNSKSAFIISLLVLGLTVASVYVFGLGRHHTFYQNSVLSTTLLSIAFFGFVSIGLYRGVKLRDTLGKVTDKISFPRRKNRKSGNSFLEIIPDFFSFSSGSNSSGSSHSFDLGDLDDEGCLGVLAAIVLWIFAAIVLSIFLWLFGEVLLVAIATFMAMLYWIFFRALKLVFRHSHHTKGHLLQSLSYGLVYTFLYNSWIYGIFWLVEYMRK